jgi:hypothetical protein
LATAVTAPVLLKSVHVDRRRSEPGFAGAFVTILTVLALVIHGYHPYAEDGGLYLAEIKRLLDPSLYPHGTAFVMDHLRVSLFAPLIVALVRGSQMSLGMVLLLVHLASYWLTLFAAYLLAARCFTSREARVGSVALLATWITLPIAGTSLMLMDPYVTARSISTPCVLLALVGMLEFLQPEDGSRTGRWGGLVLCCAALLAAASMHLLMAAYGLGCVLVLACVLSPVGWMRVRGTIGLCVMAVSIAAITQAFAPPESAAYLRVAATRSYWFLSDWHWYEQFGLAAPLIILAFVGFAPSGKRDTPRVAMARMAVVCGCVAVTIAALFARQGASTHMVARLQPLRIFQTVYVVMILVLGASLAEWGLQRRPMRWITAFVLLASMMLFVQRQTFPNSAHIELPWRAPQNQWEQAFIWIEKNTPKDALFALDAHYITSPGEDAQSFRAIAERSALPDYSKDGGKASIVPALTPEWIAGEAAQSGLSVASDTRRVAVLRPLGVTWVVLQQDAKTDFECDYANRAVKVCRLP